MITQATRRPALMHAESATRATVIGHYYWDP
jgi:hypothetical protein